MRQATPIQTVAAYGRLLEYSSNIRYGLVENEFSTSEIDVLALELNHTIKDKTGLDITNINDHDLLIKFENIVDKELTLFTYKYIFEDTSEEGKLRRNSFQIPIEYFKHNDISVSEPPKKMLKKWHVSVPNVVSYCKTAYTAYSYKTEINYPQQIFLTSIVNIRGKKRMMFAHLGQGDPSSYRTGINISNKTWDIKFVSFFSTNEYLNYLDKPIELFLKILNVYGVEFVLGNKIHRFIYKLSLPKGISNTDLTFNFLEGTGEFVLKTMNFMHTVIGVYVICAYVVRDDKLILDSFYEKV